MKVRLRKFRVGILLFVCAVMVSVLGPNLGRAHAQTRARQSNPPVTAEQQKQLDRLTQLEEQLQKDGDAVDSAVRQYGWDSNEADAAQQRLLGDRQEYRSLTGSLQQAGVSVPSDARGGMDTQNSQNGHCCGYGHHSCWHGCCGGGAQNSPHDGGCCHGRPGA
jgi:hypothetical protein